MKNKKLEEKLIAYERSVKFPDVSGMEHLDMLITRSAIEDNKQLLDEEQQKRLFVADNTLIRQSEYFSAAIERIGDLSEWRKHYDVQAAHWWWFLDVLTFAWPQFENASTLTTLPTT